MAKIQCKMCGGELTLPEGVFSGNCEYCGCLVTFPKISSEQEEQLYNRAEHFRRINEYDKAVAAYERIINTNPDDPEAYWGLVLSRFGIEYVEDPVTHERIPTCHRVQFESILADADYLAALERADYAEKEIYEREALRIAEIQKGILTISNQEEPFDVFICYKESDDFGKRTRDSVLAQDIYYALTQEGLKVFFSRITLEGKLGQQYEPYIFAALNSAKAMLVIGTKPEYFNAVWVRNEWSRYLTLMKRDRSKLLIPCFRDMDAYDIPEELSMFQAQDMSKIGFIQDILHGVKKVAAKSAPAAAPAVPAAAMSSGKSNPLLRRAQLFVVDGEFESALQYCEKLLDQEPENGWIYYTRMMAELKINDEKQLETIDFTQNKSFKNIMRFADNELNAKINAFIRARLEAEQIAEEMRLEAERKAEEARLEAERKAEEARKEIERKAEEARKERKNDLIISDSTVIKAYNIEISEAIIPDGITEIGENAFAGCSNLQKVVIPSSVTRIRAYAFSQCSSLHDIVIPNSVEIIEEYTFCDCSSLQHVSISDNVTVIKKGAFFNCANLIQIMLPDNIEHIEYSAFDYCPVEKDLKERYPKLFNGVSLKSILGMLSFIGIIVIFIIILRMLNK